MVADMVVIVTLCLPVLAIGFGVGVRFATGAPGVLAFVGFSALWGLVFTGLPYAVALKTGSPAAVSATFVVFFPLFFLSDAVVAQASAHRLVLHHRHLQPGDLCARRPALAHHVGVAGAGPAGRFGRPDRDRRGEHVAGIVGPARPDQTKRLMALLQKSAGPPGHHDAGLCDGHSDVAGACRGSHDLVASRPRSGELYRKAALHGHLCSSDQRGTLL